MKETKELFAAAPFNYAGSAEGNDVFHGTTDVIVCEGFVGNIVLKMLEGVGEVARDLAKHAYDKKLRYKLALGLLSGKPGPAAG